VIVSSFNPLALRRFREIMPDVALGFLHGLESPPVVHALMAGFACPFYHPEAALIDAALMAKAQAEGQRVIAWTINAPEEARRLRDLGVYGIITDAPARLRAAVADDP
jgi:glycerophosphoryl diester phosphodiesterase